jgi:tRNA-binding protein
MATVDDFLQLDIRVGRIVQVREFPEARKPAYQLTIDFGPELGVKRSSAQLVARYSIEDLTGKLVLGVVNFPPRRIGPFESEVLTLGVPDAEGNVVLIGPDAQDVVIGGRLF